MSKPSKSSNEAPLAALRAQIEGEATDHPCLADGWRVQLFTDAAALSAKEKRSIELGELDCV